MGQGSTFDRNLQAAASFEIFVFRPAILARPRDALRSPA
jgi:hypothetical protein